MSLSAIKQNICTLYEGDTPNAHRFRYAMFLFDIGTMLFLIVSTFFYGHDVLQWLNVFFGILITLDFASRYWIAQKKAAFVLHPLSVLDVVVIISFLAPLLGANFAFLRALRVLRLLHSYSLRQRLTQDFPLFRQHDEVVLSSINLFIFIFLMTELVFITQVETNPHITNFLDALYFTIATLTTTGFGDVTLQGQSGRALSIVIMIFGVSLFLRLIQTLFRPFKVRFTCDACGLFLHDRDAVHCKHCGKVLATPSEGDL
jgi:voltage-gated potassium channel